MLKSLELHNPGIVKGNDEGEYFEIYSDKGTMPTGKAINCYSEVKSLTRASCFLPAQH